MAKLFIVYVLVVIGLVLPCMATIYTVGDSSGWDISSDLDSWTTDKKFVVGDALLFQYSSSHSVSEVTRGNYDGCNTTVVLKTYSDGNTTIPLTKGGQKYFVCGNKLHCLGGMRLQVNVEEDQANSPAGAPAQSPGSFTQPSSKNDNPATSIPTSHGFINHGGCGYFLLASLGFMTTVVWMFKI